MQLIAGSGLTSTRRFCLVASEVLAESIENMRKRLSPVQCADGTDEIAGALVGSIRGLDVARVPDEVCWRAMQFLLDHPQSDCI